jgi:hypothetical protein
MSREREDDDEPFGPKESADLVRRTLEAKKSIREAWLADAYRLRGKYGHGDVTAFGYRVTWQVHEHLLLAAFVFPLVVKAVLVQEGFYEFTKDDDMANAIFETLATYDAFAPDPKPRRLDEHNNCDGEGDPPPPWARVTSDFQMRRLAHLLKAEFERACLRHAEEEADRRDPDRCSGESTQP